jgi:hypothetical protein
MPSSAAAEIYTDRFGFQMEKLTALNYYTWNLDCNFILCNQGLWKYVDPTMLKIVTPTAFEAENMRLVLNCIWNTISEESQRYWRPLLEGTNDPRYVWAQLKAMDEYSRTPLAMIRQSQTPSSWRT